MFEQALPSGEELGPDESRSYAEWLAAAERRGPKNAARQLDGGEAAWEA